MTTDTAATGFTGARIETDVVVVGGGGAGLAAAAAAAEAGGRVVVVEKRRVLGGNAAWAEGIFAAESPVQRRNGIDVRRDEMFQMAMDYAHWSLNGKLVRAFIDSSGDTVSWLEAKGVCFDSVPPFSPRQRHRVFHNPRRGGPEILAALVDECRSRGVRILTNAAVERILLDEGGRVAGVAVSMHGTSFEVRGASVILATGGFVGNRDLLKKYSPQYTEDYSLPGLPHRGDGLVMSLEVGAATDGLGHLQASGPNFPGKMGAVGGLAVEPCPIWLDARGERFTDEANCLKDFEAVNAILRLPDKRCWALLDQGLVDAITQDGFVRIYLGSLRPTDGSPVPSLQADLRKAAEGFNLAAQVRPEVCNGCGVCVDSCCEDAIRLDTSFGGCETVSPCSASCPAGVNIRAYVHLLRNGRIEEAGALLREYLPLPAVTGRVCPHTCEAECARNDVDQPVNIRALERFVAESERVARSRLADGRRAGSGPSETRPASNAGRRAARVAVIGSGPAGLSCSYFLARQGYPVTVFEADPQPGGMLRKGIPVHRLPRDVLDEQIDYIRELGVEFRLGTAVGPKLTLDDVQAEFAAVFFAGGTQASKKIGVEGIDLQGVEWGLDFLGRANLGRPVKVGRKVVVIGGGNVAIDCALVALRLGAEQVEMACLEKRHEMPAFAEEIAQAEAEGVAIHEGWGLKRILGQGREVAGVDLIGCAKVTDEDGCFNPSYDQSKTTRLQADSVVLAVGQAIQQSLLPAQSLLGSNGVVVIEPTTMMTVREGVFAGGDAVGGPSSVIRAIADGRKAAEAIDCYLRGEPIDPRAVAPARRMENSPRERMMPMARIEARRRKLAVGEGTQTPAVVGDFSEVTLGFDELMAKLESERCMTCGSRPVVDASRCKFCVACLENCPAEAVYSAPVRRDTPLVRISDSLDDIAHWMGADPGVLQATVDVYNSYCDKGHDPMFAKECVYLRALRTPPYYALRCNVVFLTTTGGVRVNERMEVIGSEQRPIPGLYAVGNDTGGWECETYNVFLPGSTFGFAVNSGRIAGTSAARYAGTIERASP